MIRDNFILDATALGDWRSCKEYFRQRHALGLKRERREDAADAGSAFHAALRTWFNDEGLEAALESLRSTWGPVPTIATDEKRPLGLFEAILEKYAEIYPRENDPFTVDQNEHYEKADFGAFQWCAIKDLVIQMDDGSRYCMDHKTTSGWLNASYWAQYELSPQLIGQVALELVNGRECSGAYVDAVHVDTRYKKVKDEHFVRKQFRYPQWKIDQWAKDIEHECEDIARYGPFVSERWPQNAHSCYNWHRQCPYWARCQQHEKLADDVGGYVQEFWDPKAKAEDICK